VVIDNRPGAGGTIGAAYVAKAAPDGQTVLLSDAGVATISPALFGKLPYAASDLVPVINLAQFPHVLVSAPGFVAQNLPELLALDKTRPGKAVGGVFGQWHLTAPDGGIAQSNGGHTICARALQGLWPRDQ